MKKFILFFCFIILSVSSANAQSEEKDAATDSPPLPVELVYFYGLETGDSISLFWGTATEINNYGFQVQRGFEDSTNFVTIGFVFGHGTSYSPKTYTFGDTSVLDAGRYYYRLKQIDNDGGFKYSWIINVGFLITSVKVESINVPSEFNLSQNFPNPFNPTTKIKFSIPASKSELTRTTLKVFDITGRLAANILDDELYPGIYSVEFNGTGLASGIYIYRLSIGGRSLSRKMLLLK